MATDDNLVLLARLDDAISGFAFGPTPANRETASLLLDVTAVFIEMLETATELTDSISDQRNVGFDEGFDRGYTEGYTDGSDDVEAAA